MSTKYPMQQYSIKDLENFTGIKAHTIRIWEQRYKLLEPKRTSTNIRYYTDSDLKSLLNVSILNKIGYKISKISTMSESEIKTAIQEANKAEQQELRNFSLLKMAMLNYDEDLFFKVADKAIEEFGVQETFEKLFLPFLMQIGVLWLTSAICPAQEHFISNLIRQKLFSLINDKRSVPITKEKVFVMYLSEGEIHEISLLLIHYIAKSRGYKSLYLGPSVPFADLIDISNKVDNAHFLTYCTTVPSLKTRDQFMERIETEFKDSPVHFHLVGPMMRDFSSDELKLITAYSNPNHMIDNLIVD